MSKTNLLRRQNLARRPILASFILLSVVVGVALLATTLASTRTKFAPKAVVYVNQSDPAKGFSNPIVFYTKGSNEKSADAQRTYLKFVVPAGTNLTRAKLKLYTQSNNSNGFSVRQVTSNTWNADSVTYKDAPPKSAILGATSETEANEWAEIDVSSYVKSAGTYSFVVWPKDTHQIAYSNAGDTVPQLVVTIPDAPTPSTTIVPATATPAASLTPRPSPTTTVTPSPSTSPTVSNTPAPSASPSPSPSPVTSNNGVIRAAFYYPWFPETWGSNLQDPFTNYHPSAGFYSSDDAAVVTKHIDELTYGGFDAAIASWWGQGTHNEAARIPALLNNAKNNSNGKQLKWSLYYEKESLGDPSTTEIATDLAYIKANYASKSSYLYVDNKPVIFVYADANDGCSMAQRWATANAASQFYVVLKVFSGYATCSPQPNGWHQYAPAVSADAQGAYSYSVSPGFYKKGEVGPRLARPDAATWGASIDKMIASAAKFQLVTTFNEWGEGSAVEPATEWQSASGYGSYLDVLHQKLNSSGTVIVDAAPSVSLVAPTSGQPVTGTVNVQASAVDLDASPVDSSKVVVSIDGVDHAATVSTAGLYTFSWNTAGLTAGSTHSIVARATDTAGKTGTSQTTTVSIAAAPCGTAPTAPGNLVVSAASGSASLSWSASTPGANCQLASYVVFKATAGGAFVSAAVVNVSTTSYKDTTLVAGTAYDYYVVATDSASPAHISAASNKVSVAPQACTDLTVPSTVSGIVGTPTSSSITVSWNASTDAGPCGLVGYRVYLYQNNQDTLVGTLAATQTRQYTASGLLPDTDYVLSVQAYDGSTPANASPLSRVTVHTQATQPAGDITLAVAGDVQKPRSDLHYGIDTVGLVKALNPDYALVMGDVQYESGSASDYANYYSKTWGQASLAAKVYATPGNHDYGTAGAAGYFSFFNTGNNVFNGNTVSGPAQQGWYAFDAGPNWRIYSLNSETAGSTATAQNDFLKADLAAHPKPCSIMFWHKPYYDYGTTHAGNGDATLPWMKTFYDAGGELVLTGHEHNYQTFQPVNPYTDTVDTAKGLREFVVGTGGADNLYTPLGSSLHKASSLVVTTNVNTWGIMKLVLGASSYSYEFQPIGTNGFRDSGSGQCH